jgi:hypothetical protein
MSKRQPIRPVDATQATALAFREMLGLPDELGSQANSPAMLADPEMRKRYLAEVAKEKARRRKG